MDKDRDQTAKADAGKLMLTAVPRKMIWDIAEVRRFGMMKYPDGGVDNWKRVDIQRYRDAMYRHWMAYLDNPHGLDEESGLPILWHVACNCAFLCELETFDTIQDTDEEGVHDPVKQSRSSKGISKERMVELYKSGKGTTEIARELGCTPANVTNTLKRIGITKDKQESAQEELDRGRIKALYDAGKSLSWIADDMGVDIAIIAKAFKEMKEAKEIS